MAVAANLSDYQTNYANTLAQKQADLAVTGQVGQILDNGAVVVSFQSSDIVKITALRDWLTKVIGS